MKTKLLMAALVAAFSMQVMAEAVPKSGGKDNRVQVAVYDPNEVIAIRGQVGRATLIQLEADERLEGDSASLGMGDSEAWNLAVKGNNIIFKPTAASPNTNMIITSNKRTYAFNLSLVGATNKKGKSVQSPTYILRFDYPDTKLAKLKVEHDKKARAWEVLSRVDPSNKDQAINENYWGKGHKSIAPTGTYDNGRFTFFSFNNGNELPTIYKRMTDGSEALLNIHVEEDTVVVHETAKTFVLRLGEQVLEVENRGYNSVGSFNRTGTSQHDTVRITK
jgi:type IV secretion system protein VirB9